MKKSTLLQELANLFPSWSVIRQDEQTIGAQLLNVLANRLQDIDEQLINIGKNYYVQTANLDEIDRIHRFELDPTVEFNKDESNQANLKFITPTVSGEINGVWHPVELAENNDIETFWYTSTPTRIDLKTINSGEHILLNASGIQNSPITNFDNPVPHLDGHLHVTVAGGNQFLSARNNQLSRGTVLLEGVTRKGTVEQEPLIFLFNDTQKSSKEWSELTKVSIYGIEPDTTTVTIKSARFNDGPYLDFYNNQQAINRQAIDTYWDMGQTTAGTYTLDMIRLQTDDFRNVLVGVGTDKQIIRSIELLDTTGTEFIPLDMSIQPFSNRIWVCSSGVLYLFDLDLPYPDLTKLKNKQYDSTTRIEFDEDHKVLNDSVEINYLWARPIKTIARHRVTVEKPDGSKWGLINSTLVSDLDQWVAGAPQKRAIRASDIISLDQRGEWIVTLETLFQDATSEIDQRIISVDSKSAIKEFNLGFTAVGLDFDSDHNLWILDSDDNKRRIDLKTDNMLIDFEQKILFFHEEYDQVQIII